MDRRRAGLHRRPDHGAGVRPRRQPPGAGRRRPVKRRLPVPVAGPDRHPGRPRLAGRVVPRPGPRAQRLRGRGLQRRPELPDRRHHAVHSEHRQFFHRRAAARDLERQPRRSVLRRGIREPRVQQLRHRARRGRLDDGLAGRQRTRPRPGRSGHRPRHQWRHRLRRRLRPADRLWLLADGRLLRQWRHRWRIGCRRAGTAGQHRRGVQTRNRIGTGHRPAELHAQRRLAWLHHRGRRCQPAAGHRQPRAPRLDRAGPEPRRGSDRQHRCGTRERPGRHRRGQGQARPRPGLQPRRRSGADHRLLRGRRFARATGVEQQRRPVHRRRRLPLRDHRHLP